MCSWSTSLQAVLSLDVFDDAVRFGSRVYVGRDRASRLEVQVTLDTDAQPATNGRKFGQAYGPEFREAHAEVAETQAAVV